jgi:CRISPR-associated protein Cmr2
MNQQGRFMLLFSLGSVQTFIAQARKTRDLWLGSYLLAKLMEAATEELKGDLVYPTDRIVDRERDIPDIPNKFVAIFRSSDEAHKAAEQSEIKIQRRWEEICNKVWQEIVAKHATNDTERIWKRQTDSSLFFETYWVIVAEKLEGYRQWLEYTEKLFDARKRLRDFEQQIQGEPGEKSTISGEREALRGERTDRKGVQDFWVSLTKMLSAHDIAKDGSERLDAIDTVKRFATKSPHIPDKPFPSTSSIATASFVERLLIAPIDSGVLKKWQDETRGELIELPEDAIKAIPYLQQMLNRPGVAERKWILRRDGDLYFPETFIPRRLEKDYNVTNISDSTRIAMNGGRALTTLLTATDELHITRPTPYYAMIQMDGDKMGILLSGVRDQREHVEISKALSLFSRKLAPELVEENYPARLVYVGGDDVFALAPLARDISKGDGIVTILDLVDKLQQEYHDTIAQPVSDQKRKQDVTASIGIAIVHHYTSLSYVRRMAKAAEELAKDHYGRDTLVVTVIRRSGEQTRVGCHWRYLGLTMQPIELFTHFYELFKYDQLSPKCVFTLLEEAPALVKLEKDAQQSEIRRILLRQSTEGKQKESDKKKEVGLLAEHLVKLAEAMDNDDRRKQDTNRSVELQSDKRRYGLVEVLGWLLVAAFLAKEQE